MHKFRREIKEQTIAVKTTRGKEITDASTGKAELGTITDELTAFTTANSKLVAAAARVNTTQAALAAAVQEQAAAEDAWDDALEVLFSKVESNTKGDPVKMAITTADSFEPGVSGPQGTVKKVTGLSVSDGDGIADLDLAWDSQKAPRPRLYLIQMCEDNLDESKMVQIGTATASKFTAAGLKVGHRYWFRVAAIGTGGTQSAWSDPASGVVN